MRIIIDNFEKIPIGSILFLYSFKSFPIILGQFGRILVFVHMDVDGIALCHELHPRLLVNLYHFLNFQNYFIKSLHSFVNCNNSEFLKCIKFKFLMKHCDILNYFHFSTFNNQNRLKSYFSLTRNFKKFNQA